jgi:hypothetical protein
MDHRGINHFKRGTKGGLSLRVICPAQFVLLNAYDQQMTAREGRRWYSSVHTSARAVLANPLTMGLWGLIIAASLVTGFLLAFIGLAFVLPILAHASWHLYHKVVQWIASDQDANGVVADAIMKEDSAMNTLVPSPCKSSQGPAGSES